MTRRLCACGCGSPIEDGRSDRRYLNPAHKQRVHDRRSRKRTIRRDELLAQSARMGIVERVNGEWRLTAEAELRFGAALRSLPSEICDDVRVAA